MKSISTEKAYHCRARVLVLVHGQSHLEAGSGLVSIEVMWPWLQQKSRDPHMQNFRSIGLMGAELQAPPCPKNRTLLSPFNVHTHIGKKAVHTIFKSSFQGLIKVGPSASPRPMWPWAGMEVFPFVCYDSAITLLSILHFQVDVIQIRLSWRLKRR